MTQWQVRLLLIARSCFADDYHWCRVVGNHDFDEGGVPNLMKQLAHAPKMKLLCANILNTSDDSPVFQSYEIYEFDGTRIAVVGLLGEGKAFDLESVVNRSSPC